VKHHEPPPEFNSWDEVWEEHQRRGKTITAQAATIRVLREALDDMHFAYVNKDADCLHDFEVAAIEKYKALAAAAKGGEKP